MQTLEKAFFLPKLGCSAKREELLFRFKQWQSSSGSVKKAFWTEMLRCEENQAWMVCEEGRIFVRNGKYYAGGGWSCGCRRYCILYGWAWLCLLLEKLIVFPYLICTILWAEFSSLSCMVSCLRTFASSIQNPPAILTFCVNKWVVMSKGKKELVHHPPPPRHIMLCAIGWTHTKLRCWFLESSSTTAFMKPFCIWKACSLACSFCLNIMKAEQRSSYETCLSTWTLIILELAHTAEKKIILLELWVEATAEHAMLYIRVAHKTVKGKKRFSFPSLQFWISWVSLVDWHI